ncbi:hypothetical protein RYX36_016228 [Vicia faba]
MKEATNKYQGENLYVENLDDIILGDKLKEMFSSYGTITSCKSEINELKKCQNELDTKSVSNSAGYVVSGAQEHKHIKIAIDELKKRQKDLGRESARITIDLKEKLGPIYDYEEPSLTELRTEAYKIYVTDCRFKGITAIPELDEM